MLGMQINKKKNKKTFQKYSKMEWSDVFLFAFLLIGVVFLWKTKEGMTSDPMEMSLMHQGEIERLIAQLNQIDITQTVLDDLETKLDANVQNAADIEQNLEMKNPTERDDAYPDETAVDETEVDETEDS